MNKAQLVEAVAQRAGSTPAEARRHVDAVLASIIDGVAAGERVSLLGFGTFAGVARPARTARNPRTGAAVEVPAAVVPRFRVGAGFKARVTEGDATPSASTKVSPARATASENEPAGRSATKKGKKSAGAGSKSGSKKKDSTKGSGTKTSAKKSKKGKKSKKK
ncbi:hypothetical protein GCM10009718_20190 [Isoptericola halotolerans]|nr:HU family DNA-binding protein [Isoptericola halotolerans]